MTERRTRSPIADDLHHNTTPRVGSGVWIKKKRLIRNCQIFNNRVSYAGGHDGWGRDVYLAGGGMIDACIIASNTVGTGGGTSQGGGVYMSGNNTLRNCLVAFNSHDMPARLSTTSHSRTGM